MSKFFHPNSFLKEGEDHINISSQSLTQIGLLLDPSYYKVIDYPHIGKFSSVLNLWYWLKTFPLDDSLRKLSGLRLKNRMSGKCPTRNISNFKAIIAQATYMKLLSYPNTVAQFKALPSDCVFLSYYIPKGSSLRICSSYASIVVEIATLLKKAIDTGVEPDFTSLMTRGHTSEMSFLKAFLSVTL